MFGWLRRRSAPTGARDFLEFLHENSQHESGSAGPALPDRLAEGRTLRQAGRHAEALAVFDVALGLSESPAEIHVEVALTHLAAKDLLSAVDSLEVAVTLDPGRGDAWSLLGSTLSRLDRETEAIEALRTALLHPPADQLPEVRLHLANSLHAAKRHDEAQVEVRSAIAEDPEDWRLHALLGNLLLAKEEEEEALSAYLHAQKRCPNPPEGLLLQLGSSLQRVGRFREAQKQFEAILERNPRHPVARWYLAQCDLVLGEWERGWQCYGARFAAGASPYRALPFPVWDGSPAPQATLLILADQGLGDEIMFASCFADAIRRVGHCIVECEPRLLPLFRRSFPQATVVASQREADASWLQGLVQPDLQIFAGDLPALFRRDDQSFGAGEPYLCPDPIRVKHWKRKLQEDLGEGLKIGISWRGGSRGTRSRSRSVDINEWAPLLDLPGVKFINLQYGDIEEDLAGFSSLHGKSITNYPDVIPSYEETAALVCAVDLVVTVCTSIVHLTGALGRPVWILVPYSPGFRYTLGRTALPWYGSSRMFWQPDASDWKTAVDQIAQRLLEVTKEVTL